MVEKRERECEREDADQINGRFTLSRSLSLLHTHTIKEKNGFRYRPLPEPNGKRTRNLSEQKSKGISPFRFDPQRNLLVENQIELL